jgi:Group II intron, maturase-specific domain
VNFSPAVSDDARKAISREIRSWHIARRSDKTLSDLARMFNPIVQGWITRLSRPGQPERNRRRTQAQPGLAGSRRRTPPVKGVGEPCAGEPHARFDGRALETEQPDEASAVPRPVR